MKYFSLFFEAAIWTIFSTYCRRSYMALELLRLPYDLVPDGVYRAYCMRLRYLRLCFS